jgi:branched-chain amino acid aminotransferase
MTEYSLMIDTTPSFDIHLTSTSRRDQVNFDELVFGRTFSDHMFVMEYEDGKWQRGKIEPYGPFTMSPASMVFHYGQAIFEGMKAYRQADGSVSLFRPGKNIARFNKSAERMCMPTVPEDIFMEALTALVKIDADWVPDSDDASLYIRPFMIATDSFVGVRPSEKYAFSIFTCPVNAYYREPVKVKVEQQYTRAAAGGTGYAKAAGNYAGALYPSKMAHEKGYHQLLWTDAREHKYIEESGTMNAMFVIDGQLVSPKTSDTILSGITRDSVLTLARDLGMEVIERPITVDELQEGLAKGSVTEAFGVGTAATIAPMALIGFESGDLELPAQENWKLAPAIRKELDAIRRGRIEDRFGWNIVV